ncbi:hypothetical protein ZOSMA_94G00530 [Zostera marina]|uniref:Uncharacterized protein n=1 Tax=Zostera marina TaxID=29655 RepID=A0A0K9NKB6_ZOSMR|nr:hypothetical protein ZOSMA_94G00530 [Zostera marina]
MEEKVEVSHRCLGNFGKLTQISKPIFLVFSMKLLFLFQYFFFQAFIISSTSNENKMVQWFHQYIVWIDKNVILQLISHAPMAIIKALKNSGASVNL